jgi:CBS domain-containing protein
MYEFLDYQVRDVMSRPVTIALDTSLAEAERLLEKHGFNALPVVDAERRLIGWLTTLDLLRAFRFTADSILPAYDEIMRKPVSGVMTSQPLTLTPRAPLTRVLEKMLGTRNKSFPVVEDERLVGIVAREDVMRALRRADAGERPLDPD